MSAKTYTLKENMHGSHSQQHRLVRAAWKKGLKEIKITHYQKKSGVYYEGWYLQAEQQPVLLHLGYTMNEAETRINRIEVKENV